MLTMIISKTLKENLEMLKSTPFFILVIGLEIILSNYHHRKLYNWKETATNFSLSLAIGAFESGVAARLLGTAAAVVFGGGMTLAVVVYTWIKAPTKRKLEYN